MNGTPTEILIYLGLVLLALLLGVFAFIRMQAIRHVLLKTRTIRLSPQARPIHQAMLATIYVAFFGLFIIILGIILRSVLGRAGLTYDIIWGSILIAGAICLASYMARKAGPDFAARYYTERLIRWGLIFLSIGALLTTIGIIFSLLFETMRFFATVPVQDFIFGTQWSPQTAIRDDQAGQSGAFGAVPVFSGTLLITLIAIFVAGPIGLMIAIYLSEYASLRTRRIIKPTVEILAGIPTVVYGFFALLTVGPALRNGLGQLGFDVPAQSAISAGLVMGVMIIPLVSSLSDDVINAVPQSLRDGSYALGATKSETMKRVVFVNALPGIVGAFLLAISRAVGETMIVVMAAGRAANLTLNPFDTVTTVTVQIVSLLTGDQEFDSAKTLAAFALGFVLFGATLILNIIALTVVRRYREQGL